MDAVDGMDGVDLVDAVDGVLDAVCGESDDLGGVTIFCNGVRVSGVLVKGVVFVSHEFYQAFVSEDANGSTRRWASIFRFGFGTGIGCWGGASGGAGFTGA